MSPHDKRYRSEEISPNIRVNQCTLFTLVHGYNSIIEDLRLACMDPFMLHVLERLLNLIYKCIIVLISFETEMSHSVSDSDSDCVAV